MPGAERPGCHLAVMALAGGAFTFLAFVILLGFVVAYSLYSRTGSGISQRPWRNRRSSLSHDETETSLQRR